MCGGVFCTLFSLNAAKENRISIVGATSPLGIDLMRVLADGGNEIVALHRDPARLPGLFRGRPNIELLRHDLAHDVPAAVEGTVIWLAHLDQGRFNERETEVNLAAIERFFEHSRNVLRVIFVSSGGSVYGPAESFPIDEDARLMPLSSYGKAKAAIERRLAELAAERGFGLAILRPGNIYGFSDPNHDVKGVVAAAVDSLANAAPFTLIGEGRTIRDLIHIDDVVRAVAAAIESERQNIIWNIATGKGTAVSDVITKVEAAAGRKITNIRHIENFSSDVDANILSIRRAASQSGWRPLIALDDGIERTVSEHLV